MTESATSG